MDENVTREQITKVLEQDKEERRALCILLDKWVDRRGRSFAVVSEMGFTGGKGTPERSLPSYVSVHTLDWIQANIKMGSEMPFMVDKVDKETGSLIIDEESVDILRQRAPDWSRQLDLMQYLLGEQHRKFGSILAVISPSWVDDPSHENWDENGRALKNAVKFEALDSRGLVGLLDLDLMHLYALDGQHRIIGLRGIHELQEHSYISLKKKSGKETNRTINRDDLLHQTRSDIAHLQRLLEEKMSVEYIPAVLKGETREEAVRRVRKVFVAINEYAKAPTTGENYVLDENDGFAIVARKIATTHPLFQVGSDGIRVEFKKPSITGKNPREIVTLQALRDSADLYLTAVDSEKFSTWKPMTASSIPQRPPATEIEAAVAHLHELFDSLRDLRVFEGLQRGDSVDYWRQFISSDEHAGNELGGHLMMRPIGFMIIASAFGDLVGQENYELMDVVKRFKKLESMKMLNMANPESVWYGLIYEPTKGKVLAAKGKRDLSVDLLKYLIRGAEVPERTSLLERFISQRSIDETTWWGYSGKPEVINRGEIDLPRPA